MKILIGMFIVSFSSLFVGHNYVLNKIDNRLEYIESVLADWVVSPANNICGVSSARQITNPAMVSYPRLLDIAPSMKKMKREHIKQDSAEGQVLLIKAKNTIREACKKVMDSRGYCSVWKKISHKGGKNAVSITHLVEDIIKDK